MAGLYFGFSINFPQIISIQTSPNKHSIIKFTEGLLVKKFREDTTLDQFHDKMSSLSLALFKPPPFPLSLSMADLINTEISKTVCSQLVLSLLSQTLQLILVLIPIFFLQLGAPSPPYHYLFTAYHHVHNWPPGMLWKHIILYHFTTLNGHPQPPSNASFPLWTLWAPLASSPHTRSHPHPRWAV